MIHIEDDILRCYRNGILSRLLFDRTTRHHILWATDAHAALGSEYARNAEIRQELILGDRAGVIRTQAEKRREQQGGHGKRYGVESTPFSVCKKMNDILDEDWFGRKDVFFSEGNGGIYDSDVKPVSFPPQKTWTQYVDSRRMEITCGEAPFLVSRYDAATGKEIPLEERTGILDRKLYIVTEHAQNEAEWVFWAFRAFEAVYGYEFQGDRLLIARVNLIATFEDYLWNLWYREPTKKEYERLTRIVTWNLWQMDGLTGMIPYNRLPGVGHQMSLNEWMEENNKGKNSEESYTQGGNWWDEDDIEREKELQPYCRIYDWRANESREYSSLKYFATLKKENQKA